MHYEYAVEPAAIGSNWETFRYLIEKFGFQEGRLISRFPSKWERAVIKAAEAADIPDVARKRIVEQLQKRKRTVLIRTGRDFNPDLDSWVENALASHAERPFHAIIAEGEHDGGEIISPDELDDEHPLMSAPRSRDIPRTAADIANACCLLVGAARAIDLVDPFFDLQDIDGDYTGPLRAILEAIYESGSRDFIVRVHFRAHRERPTEQFVLQNASNWVQGWLPDTFELHLYAWQEKHGGEDLHDRFVLCDCGGLMIGAGLSAVGPQENTTVVLLAEGHVQQLRAKFADESDVYDKAGHTIQIKSDGTTSLI